MLYYSLTTKPDYILAQGNIWKSFILENLNRGAGEKNEPRLWFIRFSGSQNAQQIVQQG